MTRLSGLKPKRVVKAFERLGWIVARQKGSHCVLIREDSPVNLTVPVHAKEIKQGLLRGLLTKAGISDKDFLNAYK